MTTRDERIVWKIDVIALAPQGHTLGIWPKYPATYAAAQLLDELDGRRSHHARRVVGAFGIRGVVELLRRPDLQHLFADEDRRARLDLHVAGDAHEHAVERAFV